MEAKTVLIESAVIVESGDCIMKNGRLHPYLIGQHFPAYIVGTEYYGNTLTSMTRIVRIVFDDADNRHLILNLYVVSHSLIWCL